MILPISKKRPKSCHSIPHLHIIEKRQAARRRITKDRTGPTEMTMTDREWQDADMEGSDDMGFELREMLGMLNRIESVDEFEGGAIGDFGDDFDLSSFGL